VQIGSPRAIYADPINTYVATRLGSPAINLVPRRLYPDIEAPAGAATIGVRTEHVRIRRSANGSAVGRVKWIEHLGDQNHLHVTIADTDVVTLCDRDVGVVVGDAVDVELTAPLFFAANGERVRAG
jgi:multiple sugar transport system ATP-binding protein